MKITIVMTAIKAMIFNVIFCSSLFLRNSFRFFYGGSQRPDNSFDWFPKPLFFSLSWKYSNVKSEANHKINTKHVQMMVVPNSKTTHLIYYLNFNVHHFSLYHVPCERNKYVLPY